jgi:hypothetical protein
MLSAYIFITPSPAYNNFFVCLEKIPATLKMAAAFSSETLMSVY